MIVSIKVFAGLKEFFGPELYLEGEENIPIKDIIGELSVMEPQASPLLAKCRFAVAEEFVPISYRIKNGEELYLIPPSSGG